MTVSLDKLSDINATAAQARSVLRRDVRIAP